MANVYLIFLKLYYRQQNFWKSLTFLQARLQKATAYFQVKKSQKR